MNRSTLGPGGPEVSEMGLGCMGMSAFYGTPDEAEANARKSLDIFTQFKEPNSIGLLHTQLGEIARPPVDTHIQKTADQKAEQPAQQS